MGWLIVYFRYAHFSSTVFFVLSLVSYGFLCNTYDSFLHFLYHLHTSSLMHNQVQVHFPYPLHTLIQLLRTQKESKHSIYRHYPSRLLPIWLSIPLSVVCVLSPSPFRFWVIVCTYCLLCQPYRFDNDDEGSCGRKFSILDFTNLMIQLTIARIYENLWYVYGLHIVGNVYFSTRFNLGMVYLMNHANSWKCVVRYIKILIHI